MCKFYRPLKYRKNEEEKGVGETVELQPSPGRELGRESTSFISPEINVTKLDRHLTDSWTTDVTNFFSCLSLL